MGSQGVSPKKIMKLYMPVTKKKKLNHRGAARLLSAIGDAWSALTPEPHVFAIRATSSYLGL